MLPAKLTLKDGSEYHGFSPDWQKETTYGEVVFTTGMTGYFESLTDPSYAGQILVFTYPLIGNYGVPGPAVWESPKIHAAGVVAGEVCKGWNHPQSKWSFHQWLESQRVPLITHVDTRALAKHLRSRGSVPGALSSMDILPTAFLDPNQTNLVDLVSPKEKSLTAQGKKKVIAVDCGMKKNILRCLTQLPIQVVRVPHSYDYSQEEFDGVFLSNGPGDPTHCQEAVAILKKVMERGKPIFGICLGTQLMALAAGASTFKLPFGHRGHNQPCMDLRTQRCYITSQNHGYAIQEASLPQDWQVTFRNLNDQSVEGIAHRVKPFFAVQFHPEAAPGPTDTQWLFQQFYDLL